MPIIKSAKKRVRQAKKASVLNSKTKRNFKDAVKSVQKSLQGGKKADNFLKSAQSTLDKAVKKGVIHKNKAARQKSRLAKAASKAAGKPAGKKATPKKK